MFTYLNDSLFGNPNRSPSLHEGRSPKPCASHSLRARKRSHCARAGNHPTSPQRALFADCVAGNYFFRRASPSVTPGSGSDEDNELYLKYYADEDYRQRWHKDWPNDVIPPHVDPPYNRDSKLPKSSDE